MGPSFVRFQNFGSKVPGRAWWMVMAPGLMLIALAVSILVWPELLAYMVAFLILSLGLTVTGWGWRLRQIERRRPEGINEPKASDAVIYYEH